MLDRRWIFSMISREEQRALASLLGISPITASVLLARGIATREQAHVWMAPEQAAVHDPFLLPDMDTAVARLHRAVLEGERICFYGDYDVDGVAATSLYVTFFRAAGADVQWYIPNRFREGYGLNGHAVRRLANDGVTVLVTSDCGTTAHDSIELANRLGIDVLVTDHHRGDDRLPPALALLNPHRSDSRYPFTGLCSAALAYKVVQAYSIKYGGACTPASLLDLVALATVADVVPLVDENRSFVRAGLALMTRTPRCGLDALKRSAGVEQMCTAATVAFRLAPRINAAGRLDDAGIGVHLLTTESETTAHDCADRLERLNGERQCIEEDISAEAMAAVEKAGASPAIVVASTAWHLGVVGIVAARLVERYHRPSVVIAIDQNGVGRGSARSVPGFDLYKTLFECRDVLEGFGGHASAAGLTIREYRISEFTGRFIEQVERWSAGRSVDPILQIDAEIDLTELGLRVVKELEGLHPYGLGNPEPVLAARNVTILDRRIVGDGHLKLTIRQKRSLPFETIGFRMGSLPDRSFSVGCRADLAFMPELHRWNGLDRIQLRLQDMKTPRSV